MHSPRTIVSALAAALVVFALTAAPAAARTVPEGAYWFTDTYDLPSTWRYSEGSGVVVAVIDAGIRSSVGTLRGQTVTGADLTGRDPGADDEQPTSTNYGHGTDMAAKIAGSGQGGGMVGIAPKAKIMPIDASAPGGGIDPDLGARGIRLAVERGARVINLSFGSQRACLPQEASAIEYAYQHDVIVVASAGDSPGAVAAPAICPGALAIGGVDAEGRPWKQTPSGPQIDFVAPAADLVNQQLDGSVNAPDPGNSGTSSSAAFASGIFALLIAKFPHDTARQIVTKALYWTHTGRGDAGIDKRIDNYLGYGELLPYYPLSRTTPASATNPIYDAFDRELSAGSPGSATESSSPTDAASSAPVAAAGSDDHAGTVIWVVVIAVVAAGVVGVVLTTTRRRRHTGPSAGR